MLALPPGPQPAPKRQIFVGTAAAIVGGAMLVGTMMATWLAFRAAAPNRAGEPGERDIIKDWLPADIVVPEVASNMAVIGVILAAIMGQWAVYAGVRGYRSHVGMALGMNVLMGLAALNAQAFVWSEMGVGVETKYGALFYAVTVTVSALLVIGLLYSAVAVFRYLGGRSTDGDILVGNAMYWYFVTAAYAVMWFVIYVQK